MRWVLNDAGTSEARIKRLEKHGKDIPEHLFPPEVYPEGLIWLEAFWELSTDRQLTGYGAGPIPAASIDRHCAGWQDEEKMAFRACIRAMDAEFIKSQSGDEVDIPESDNPARDAFRAAMKG